MRALVIDKEFKITVGESFNYRGEYFHHLVSVVRIKEGEEILLLNGLGSKWYGKILKVNKREIEILPEKYEVVSPKRREVAFCLVKKDSLEIILRSVVEMGCSVDGAVGLRELLEADLVHQMPAFCAMG